MVMLKQAAVSQTVVMEIFNKKNKQANKQTRKTKTKQNKTKTKKEKTIRSKKQHRYKYC